MKTNQSIILEKHLNVKNIKYLIGIDEVGWGAICGPLVVTAAVLPINEEPDGLKDSKKFTTDKSRAKGAEIAKKAVTEYQIVEATPEDICKYGPGDTLGYLQRNIAKDLLEKYPNSIVIIDGNKPIPGIKKNLQLALVSADAKIKVVSAASIIAKVYRDNLMIELSNEYPTWDFHKNKGYPTVIHLKYLEKHGPTKHHRMNVAQVSKSYEKHGRYEEEGS